VRRRSDRQGRKEMQPQGPQPRLSGPGLSEASKKPAEFCKFGRANVRDGPVIGAAVAPDLNGIALGDKSKR
jgi:hypothetical protein